MRTFTRIRRWLAAVALASMAGSLPSCGTMGGGMGHLVEPPSTTTGAA
jgi:hypothetical protein